MIVVFTIESFFINSFCLAHANLEGLKSYILIINYLKLSWKLIFVFIACVCNVHMLTQLCLIPCNSMNCSPAGSSVHGEISMQERQSSLPFPPPGISQPRDQTCVPYVACLGRWIHYHWHQLGS